MIADVLTVTWKDLREVLLQSGSVRKSLRMFAVSIVVFGVVLPLQIGPDLVREPAAILPWAWVPLFLSSGMIADGLAGERERHTLETLLASRLPDAAILIGKVVAAIVYGWGFMVVSAAVGLITVNLANVGGGLLVFSPEALVLLGVFGLLAAGLVSSVGALVALRAPSVRQAAQNMSLAIFAIVLGPILVAGVLPRETQRDLLDALAALDWTALAFIAATVLVAADAGFLGMALARFRRTRLILD